MTPTKEDVDRLAKMLQRHSAKHMLDAADALLALRAALDAAEREKQEAVTRVREECAQIANIYAGDNGLKSAAGWTEEYSDAWETGGCDHALAIAAALQRDDNPPD